jgi:flagellar basal-body rod protein FlgC
MTVPPFLGFLPSPLRPLVKPMFRTLGIAASGLSAQRVRIETIATNIANAETTRTETGGPYRRRVAVMENAPLEHPPYSSQIAGVPPFPRMPYETDPIAAVAPFDIAGVTVVDAANGVRVSEVVEDPSEGPLVYNPGHPDADESGYVRMPNVRVTDEIVDMMDARRVFEANASVFQTARAILRRSIDI